MRELLTSFEFWVAMALASIIKIKASPALSWRAAAITIVAAVAAALVFTHPVLDFFDLAGETYAAAVAALVALTAEHLARQILDMRLTEILKAWRAHK